MIDIWEMPLVVRECPIIMIDWIPTAIIVAIATASLAVVSMGVFVGTLGLVGYYRIKTEAASVATEAAKNAMEEYIKDR